MSLTKTGAGQITLTGTQYPLSLTSIASSALGLYSTRTLLPTYTGPVVQVRRGSDSTIYDFKSDPYGNLSNLQFTTTIGAFLSATTGYISTWYDQSGGSNNFSQPTTSSQPQIALNSGQWVMYMPNQSSNLNTQSMTGINGLMTILLNFNLPSSGFQTILGNIFSSTDASLGLRFRFNNVLGGAVQGFYTGSDFLGSTGSYWYLNNSYGTLVNPSTAAVSGNSGYYPPANWNQVIGTQGSQSFGSGQFNTINPGKSVGRGAGPGYISEMMLFSGSISATDAGTLWKYSPIVNNNLIPFISLKGTPLFSQLSAAAAASAMGAFSLRAVNGLSTGGTAKAVNIVPGGTFPPSAMSPVNTNSSTQTLGTGVLQGSYTASASTSAYGNYPTNAFRLGNNGGYNPYIWQVASYPAGGGTVATPTTTTTGATNYNGEWLQFQTPFAINITSYSVGTQYLTSFVLLGSTTGATSSWTLIDSSTTPASFTTTTKTGLTAAAYSYFRFVIITSTTAFPLLAGVQFTGYKTQVLPVAGFSTSATQNGNQFTQALSGDPYTGTYVANCSSFYSASGSDQPWRCFDKNNNGTWWTCATGPTYLPGTGQYYGYYSTTISGSAYAGEWVQIQLPVGIPITSYTIYNSSSWTGRAPKDFKLAGSNNGTTWTLIDTQTGITSWASSTTSLTFTPSTQTTAYTYFRLCVNYTNGLDYYLSIGELILNVNQDFYADRLGNLLTAPITGQTLSSWLGGATGYVATWYDQSGKGNHMSCSSAAIRPILDTANNWIDFKTSAYFDTSANPTAGPSPWDSTKRYTVTCHHNTIAGAICGSFDSVYGNSTNKTNNFSRNAANYYDGWYFNDAIGGTYAVGNKVSFKWDGTNRYIYGNGSLQYTLASSGWSQSSSANQNIGKNNINGEMYSIFMFNTALSDADRALVEAAS